MEQMQIELKKDELDNSALALHFDKYFWIMINLEIIWIIKNQKNTNTTKGQTYLMMSIILLEVIKILYYDHMKIYDNFWRWTNAFLQGRFHLI